MNIIVLVGRLARDPELRTVNTVNGQNQVCSFTIAVSRQYSNQNGERDADFINCTIWGKQAENLCKYCNKGSQIGVQGRIQTRNYQNKEGVTVYTTEVSASNITFLSSKGSSQPNTGYNNYSQPNSGYNYNEEATNPFSKYEYPQQNNTGSSPNIQTNNMTENPFQDFGSEVVLSDDDLPF